MKMPIDKEWFEKRAAAEGDLEISAGSRKLTMTLNLTDEEIATLERVALDGLPIWARERIEQLERENAGLRSELESARSPTRAMAQVPGGQEGQKNGGGEWVEKRRMITSPRVAFTPWRRLPNTCASPTGA